MKIAIITINKNTDKLARKLKSCFKNAKIFKGRMTERGQLKNLVRSIFNKYEGLIFIGAVGIAVRLISPLTKSKLSDPAVVSVDSAARFSVSLLSGHEGGANRLAFLVAASLDALPVVTTGREVRKKFILGIGTRRGIGSQNVKRAVKKAIKKKGIKLEEIRIVATVDLKKNEPGLLKACSDLDLPLVFIPKQSIRNFKGNISVSEVVRRNIGLEGICEPCALLAGRRTRLIFKKEVLGQAAVAIAQEG